MLESRLARILAFQARSVLRKLKEMAMPSDPKKTAKEKDARNVARGAGARVSSSYGDPTKKDLGAAHDVVIEEDKPAIESPREEP